MFVKVGDKVRVIAGKDKGKEGTIIQTIAEKNRVVVEGANLIKKHQKANGQDNKGGIISKEAAIDASNVKLLTAAKSQYSKSK